jgi:hypothetical protein
VPIFDEEHAKDLSKMRRWHSSQKFNFTLTPF